ncbi:helix-turn-helix domain-containing protein [Variovorax gracilis]|uniref:helix-turn-helix domain-containing protein n=1 Tax=Variovorax gracilis TaxID=3053502 RepID=UPI00336BD983
MERGGFDYTRLLEESRCLLATQLLSDTEMPRGEISAMLGYSTQGNFTRAFCRWFEVTPSAWRQAHAEPGRGRRARAIR